MDNDNTNDLKYKKNNVSRHTAYTHNSNNEPRKNRVALIREEYYQLTGSSTAANLLNNFIYWQQRVKHIDDYLKAESNRSNSRDLQFVPLTNGWVYKTAAELKEECLLDLAENTILTYVKQLVDAGWILRRRNPNQPWDKTWQYRVDLIKLKMDLMAIGHDLAGWKIELPKGLETPAAALPSAANPCRCAISNSEASQGKPEVQQDESEEQYQRLQTKTTTESLTTYVEQARPVESEATKNNIEKVFKHWQTVMQHPKAVLDDRRRRLIRNALKAHGLETCIKAVDGCYRTPYNMGGNDKGTIYDAVDLIFRNSDKIEFFARNFDQPPVMKVKPQHWTDEKAQQNNEMAERYKLRMKRLAERSLNNKGKAK